MILLQFLAAIFATWGMGPFFQQLGPDRLRTLATQLDSEARGVRDSGTGALAPCFMMRASALLIAILLTSNFAAMSLWEWSSQ